MCRAIEDRLGPAVEQQFGEFPTWTQALGYADKLNQGLDLDLLDVRQIVTSSLLATTCVLQEALHCQRLWSTAQFETRAAHLRFVIAQVTLALTFCRSAFLLSNLSAHRVLLSSHNALNHASLFLGSSDGEDRQPQGFASRTNALDAGLQALAPSFRSSPTAQEQCWPGDLYRTEELKRKATLRNIECLSLFSTASETSLLCPLP